MNDVQRIVQLPNQHLQLNAIKILFNNTPLVQPFLNAFTLHLQQLIQLYTTLTHSQHLATVQRQLTTTLSVCAMMARHALPVESSFHTTELPQLLSCMLSLLEQQSSMTADEMKAEVEMKALNAVVRLIESFHNHFTPSYFHSFSFCAQSRLSLATSELHCLDSEVSLEIARLSVELLLFCFETCSPQFANPRFSHIFTNCLTLCNSLPHSSLITPSSSLQLNQTELLSDCLELMLSMMRRLVMRSQCYESSRLLKVEEWMIEDEDEEEEGEESLTAEDELSSNQSTAANNPSNTLHFFTQPATSPSCRLQINSSSLSHFIKNLLPFINADILENTLTELILTFLPHSLALLNCIQAQQSTLQSDLLFATLNSLLSVCESVDMSRKLCVSQIETLLPSLQHCVEWSNASVSLSDEQLVEFYNRLLRLLLRMQQESSRVRFVKMRRPLIDALIAFLYAINTRFQRLIGHKAFFTDFHPLLQSPLVVVHIVYCLRDDGCLPNVLPVVISTLTCSPSKSLNTSMVRNYIQAIGLLTCFTTPQQSDGLNALLRSYLSTLFQCVLNTVKSNPDSVGVDCVVALTRMLLSCYSEEIVRELFFLQAFVLFASVLDESCFANGSEEEDEETYSDADQDLIAQLQLCTLHMLNATLFDCQGFVLTLKHDYKTLPHAMTTLLNATLHNVTQPCLFDDDVTIRTQCLLCIDKLATTHFINRTDLQSIIQHLDKAEQLHRSQQHTALATSLQQLQHKLQQLNNTT